MMQKQAHVTTENASRYLQQLCKHWSHRFKVEFTPDAGRVEFSNGHTDLAASANALAVTVHAESAEKVTELCGIVEEHLKRFAFREELDFVWS